MQPKDIEKEIEKQLSELDKLHEQVDDCQAKLDELMVTKARKQLKDKYVIEAYVNSIADKDGNYVNYLFYYTSHFKRGYSTRMFEELSCFDKNDIIFTKQELDEFLQRYPYPQLIKAGIKPVLESKLKEYYINELLQQEEY